MVIEGRGSDSQYKKKNVLQPGEET